MNIKIFLIGAFSAMTISTVFSDPVKSAKQYPVDEDIFLKKIIDVSSPEEKILDNELLKPPAKQYPFPGCKVENVNGSLKATCNGNPVQMLFRSCSATTLPGAPVERMMRENGINIFMIDIDFHSNLSEAKSHAFNMFKTRADNILKSVPDAKFLVRIWMMKIGDDFIEKHPEALLTGPNGETKCDELFKRYGKYYYPNMLGAWKRWNGQYLRTFLELLGESEYASRAIGCYIGAMNTGEWWYYKPTPFVWDYSSTRKEAYSRFLEIKYGNEFKNLSKYGLDGYLEKNIQNLPLPAERNKRPITPCGKVSDYNQLLNMPVTNAALFFGRIIKTMSNDRMLAGFEIHAGIECFPVNGTVFLSQLFESKYVDFLGGPPEYPHRGPGNSPWYRVADGSMKKHGKLWFNEGDYRFHSSYGTKTGILGEPTISPEETVNVMRREFARMMIKNYYTYLMDFQWYWFFDKKLAQEFTRLNAIQKFIDKTGIKRNPQIALVTDQESQLYSNYYANPSHMIRIFNDKLGCDSEYFELRDFLESKNKENFKMVIFLNIRALSDRERSEIEKLKTNNRVIVWMHDPGMINLTRINANVQEDLKKLIGIEVKASDKDIKEKISLNKDEYIKMIKNARPMSLAYDGPENNIIEARINKEVCAPDCSEGSYIGNVLKDVECIDKDAIKLGSDGSGKCRLAMKKFPVWTSVYAASCLIDPAIIKDLAKLAGCHIYMNSNDILFSSEDFLAIHASSSGKKLISLPRKSGVYEIFGNQTISENASSFEIDMKLGETKFFYLGNPASAADGIKKNIEELAMENQEFIKKYPASEVAEANAEYCRSQPPEKFFSLGSRKSLNINTAKGEFPIINLCPSAFLVSGPFSNDAESLNKLRNIMKELSGKPELIHRTDKSGKAIFKINKKADMFLQSADKSQAKVIDINNITWNALSCPLPWIYDYDLGMQENQASLIAFFLKANSGEKSEILFTSDGTAEILFNGKPLQECGVQGNRGIIVEHSTRNDIIIIMFSNKNKASGETGFTFKIFKPDSDLKTGEQVKKHTENVSVLLNND